MEHTGPMESGQAALGIAPGAPGDAAPALDRDGSAPDVSLIMPCLNEIDSLPHCIANARDALAQIEARYGLIGEVVIADNGSRDGSQALSETLGARVAPVSRRGYGAALIGGCQAAAGRYLLMGDADGSYDFRDGVAMIGRLIDGADLCIGLALPGRDRARRDALEKPLYRQSGADRDTQPVLSARG